MPMSTPAKMGALRMEGSSPPCTATGWAGGWLAGAGAAAGAAASGSAAPAGGTAGAGAAPASGLHATSSKLTRVHNVRSADARRMTDLLAASPTGQPRTSAAQGGPALRRGAGSGVRALREHPLGLKLVHELTVVDLRVGQIGRVRVLLGRHGLPHPVQPVRRNRRRPGQVAPGERVRRVQDLGVVGLQVLVV